MIRVGNLICESWPTYSTSFRLPSTMNSPSEPHISRPVFELSLKYQSPAVERAKPIFLVCPEFRRLDSMKTPTLPAGMGSANRYPWADPQPANAPTPRTRMVQHYISWPNKRLASHEANIQTGQSAAGAFCFA